MGWFPPGVSITLHTGALDLSLDWENMWPAPGSLRQRAVRAANKEGKGYATVAPVFSPPRVGASQHEQGGLDKETREKHEILKV